MSLRLPLAFLCLTLALITCAACSDSVPVSAQLTPADSGDDTAAPDVSAPEPDAPEDVAQPEDATQDTPSPPDASTPDTSPPDAVEPDAEMDTTGEDTTGEDTGEDTTEEDTPQSINEECFPELIAPDFVGPDYDQFMPSVGSHCSGTNNQDITDVEQVVFFGDSVTQGTPNDEHLLCIENEHFYRNRLADWLQSRFDLDTGDLVEWGQWRTYSCQYDGLPGRRQSGDFLNCSKWGGRTDDLLGEANCAGRGEETERCCTECCAGGVCDERGSCVRKAATPETDSFCGTPDKQVFQCLPSGGSTRRTLFVFTMGGNDIASITQDGAAITSETPEGRAEIEAGYPSMWREAQRMVAYLEEAVTYLKDPARFPNGSYVVFANPFEFTDSTGDVSACSPDSINIPGIGELDISSLGLNLAELGGFGSWERPEVQREIVVWITEQFMRIATTQGADMVWMLEAFCGHGYVAAGSDPDMSNRCYREDDPTLWFDITCIHPNERGHEAIFNLFRDVILE